MPHAWYTSTPYAPNPSTSTRGQAEPATIRRFNAVRLPPPARSVFNTSSQIVGTPPENVTRSSFKVRNTLGPSSQRFGMINADPLIAAQYGHAQLVAWNIEVA